MPLKISVDIGENFNDPARFVECAVLAEKFNFDTVWFGDHFMPWYDGGKRSSFVWSVMAVALAKTNRIKIGPDVTCPIGGRFHPAIVAQASATLDNMYPGRFPLGLGSGEAINEAKFLGRWPPWRERIERLCEGIDLMRKLWDSDDYFTFKGKYFAMDDVYLYTKPKSKIPVYFSAIGVKAANFAGTYGDHLITMGSAERYGEVIYPAFEDGAKKAGKDPSKMEKMILLDLYLGSKEEGLKELKATGEGGSLDPRAVSVLDPRKIEELGHEISDDVLVSTKYFCSTPEEIIDVINEYIAVGTDHIAISTHSFPERIKMLGEKVLPHFF